MTIHCDNVTSGQVRKPQILGLIPLSEIRKFFWCVSLQIANPQFFIINPQIAIRYCTTLSKDSAQSRLGKRFLCKKIDLEHHML